MTIGERIKMLREEMGITQSQLAEKVNTTKQTIYKYENNIITNIPSDKIEIISNFFGISPAILMGWDENNDKQKVKGVRIPVLGYVRAGIPIDAIEEIIGWEEITPELAATGEFFCLEIKGDSMTPQIADGDIVVVRQQPDVESGEVGIVIVNGDEATCKKIIKYDETHSIGLVSFNTSYDPMYFSETDIIEKPVAIIGKVVELRRKF